MKLSAIRLFVYDLSAAGDFYAHALGLPFVAGDEAQGYLVFNAGGTRLVIERVTPDAPEEEHQLVGRFTGLSFEVDDIHDAHRRLQQAGVSFSGAPERQAWGGTLATMSDPSNNEVQLVQYPRAGQDSPGP